MYPISNRQEQIEVVNPYVDDFMASVTGDFKFINTAGSSVGILDVLKYLPRIEYIFLNWIEDVPDKKFGRLQTAVTLLVLHLAGLVGIRIVWTMHNKRSHAKENPRLKKRLFKALLKKSNLIITHVREGLDYAEENAVGSGEKIYYAPHPVKDRRGTSHHKPGSNKKTDVLLWGSLAPYKGISEFLSYLKQQGLDRTYNILIVGQPKSQDYLQELRQFENESIEIRTGLCDDKAIGELVKSSRIVLFTYAHDSVFSSGALMDTLGYGARVVGPDTGAFRDHENDGLVKTFGNFEELITVIDEALGDADPFYSDAVLDGFLEENSWKSFASKLSDKLFGKETGQL